tara:strand:+ start:225 stop:425 length:201 start_codon:yes stop_codon:yes gene_type:complete
MGEAKRRRELGLPPKTKKIMKDKNNDKKFSLSHLSITSLKSKFPAAPFVTTALFLLALQWGLTIGS